MIDRLEVRSKLHPERLELAQTVPATIEYRSRDRNESLRPEDLDLAAIYNGRALAIEMTLIKQMDAIP